MPRHPLPASLEIRAARLSDAEGIAALSNLPGYRWGTLRPAFQSLRETLDSLEKAAPGDVRLVAELNGAIVGAAHLTRFAGRRSHAGSIGLGVHDDWVGNHIGHALFAALVDVADNWLGLRRLELTVHADNASAIALYQQFGFTEEGLFRAYALRDGVLVDTLAMGRVVAGPGVQSSD